jgi:hypothetical protein
VGTTFCQIFFQAVRFLIVYHGFHFFQQALPGVGIVKVLPFTVCLIIYIDVPVPLAAVARAIAANTGKSIQRF